MLDTYEKYSRDILATTRKEEVVAILMDVAGSFGFRSAFLVEYVDRNADVLDILDTDPVRAGGWASYFQGPIYAQERQAIMVGMFNQSVVRMDATRMPGRPPGMEEFVRQNDLLNVTTFPMSLAEDVIGAAGFVGEPSLTETELNALQLLAYLLFTHTRAIRSAVQVESVTPLTPREREVISLSATGMTSQQVADELGISPRTVNQHVDNVAFKLGTRNRTHTVVEAIRHKLLD